MTGPDDRPAADPPPRPQGAPRDNPPAPRRGRAAAGWRDYLADPRTAVLVFLTSALVLGGGRRVLQSIRARRIVAALAGPDPEVDAITAAAECGRAGLPDLFRLLESAEKPEVRAAAGRALARLWRADELIAEEEKAVVRRGYAASFRARRTYPRDLAGPIVVGVDLGVPFLDAGGSGVGPENIAWSHRVVGAERAGLEAWTEPRPGRQSFAFEIFPGDFAGPGPHRLVLQARARAVGLTDAWEFELPPSTCAIEFSSHLGVVALLAAPDAARGERFARAVTLEPPAGPDIPPIPLTPGLVLRDPPAVMVRPPLPCDLAHRIRVEFEGVAGLYDAGSVVVAAAGLDPDRLATFPIGPIAGLPVDALDRPGARRVRAHLVADPGLGWATPEVRSIWPEPIVTPWVDARVARL